MNLPFVLDSNIPVTASYILLSISVVITIGILTNYEFLSESKAFIFARFLFGVFVSLLCAKLAFDFPNFEWVYVQYGNVLIKLSLIFMLLMINFIIIFKRTDILSSKSKGHMGDYREEDC